jgi:4-diphosphocytidyl-2-C-methyl-D-erythritol kinase
VCCRVKGRERQPAAVGEVRRRLSRVAEVEAPAKVNLFLRVFDARPDGYHELETLFQAIDLVDRVRVELGGDAVELEVLGADLGPTQDNLAYRAATKLLAELGRTDGARITLEKRIPAGAGLGGGSSDAAAVLRCLAALCSVRPYDPSVRRIGGELGSDVPFFLGASPLAVGRGRGDRLVPLTALPEAHLVLVSPPVHVSTGWAYGALDEARRGRGGPSGGPVLGGRPSSWQDVVANAHNDFQEVVAATHPQISRALGALRAAGAVAALMSGSGSTSFGVFPDRVSAHGAEEAVAVELGWPCRLVRTLAELPRPTLL